MSQYDKLDLLIYEAIKAGARSFDIIESSDARVEANRLYAENPGGKVPFRHIYARLQALRKRGLIEFNRGRGGWVIKIDKP